MAVGRVPRSLEAEEKDKEEDEEDGDEEEDGTVLCNLEPGGVGDAPILPSEELGFRPWLEIGSLGLVNNRWGSG